MSIITILYNDILYRPLFNALIFLYNIIPGHDFGVAIILLTLIIRFALYPLSQKSIKSQKELQVLQPKVKEIQEKYKGNREKQSVAMMELYKTHKVNPATGCLLLLAQLPILLALFSVFRHGLDPQKLNALYSFVKNPGVINPLFIGLINLSRANIILAVMAGIAQFFQTKMITPPTTGAGTDMAATFSRQMIYIFPLVTIYIAASLPAGLALYWVVTTLFAIVQQYFGLRQKNGEQQQTKN